MDVERMVRDGAEFLRNALGALDRERNAVPTLPSNAKKFPNRKVGDFLWNGDLTDGGISRAVIVAKDRQDYVIVVDVCEVPWNEEWRFPAANWACDWYSESAAEAVEEGAKKDMAYYAPRLNYVANAMKAAKAGDVSKFLGGFTDPDD